VGQRSPDSLRSHAQDFANLAGTDTETSIRWFIAYWVMLVDPVHLLLAALPARRCHRDIVIYPSVKDCLIL